MSWLQRYKWTRASRNYSESSSIIFTTDEHQDWVLEWQNYVIGMLRCMDIFITTTGLNLTPNNGQQDLMIIAGASLSRQPTPRCHTNICIGSENETRVGVGHACNDFVKVCRHYVWRHAYTEVWLLLRGSYLGGGRGQHVIQMYCILWGKPDQRTHSCV